MVHLFPSNLDFNACIPVQGITVVLMLQKITSAAAGHRLGTPAKKYPPQNFIRYYFGTFSNILIAFF